MSRLSTAIIDEKFLKDRPDCIFVFGDNTLRRGKGGAAKLRDFENTYGFITKKYPLPLPSACYTVEEYIPIFHEECAKLRDFILSNPDKTFYISKLGANRANFYKIFEHVIEPSIKSQLNFSNVVFLF